jgi:hypothetical protein
LAHDDEPGGAAVDTLEVGVGVARLDLGAMARRIARVQAVVEMHGVDLARRHDAEARVSAVARRRWDAVEAVDRRLRSSGHCV